MAACDGYTVITRNYVYNTAHDLRHRFLDQDTDTYYFGGQHNEEFNSTFFTRCGEVIRQLEIRAGKTVDWIGDVGVAVCKSGYHGSGRAFDLGQIRFADGSFIDTNDHWRGTAAQKRQYIGLAAQCRLVVGTVLTAWYLPDLAHQNHIHFDNGTAFVPIRESADSDTGLIQATCNILNGESLTIDDDWGPMTEAAYNRLRTKLKVQCLNPKGNAADATLFLGLIAQTGLNGQLAGAYLGPC
jgi:hypothetical protein